MKTLTIKTAALLTVAATALFSLSACNTFEGFGKDVQKGGKAIEDAAD